MIEREAFAVIEMLKRVRTWIFGYKIHLHSDHNPLAYLTESAPKSAKKCDGHLFFRSMIFLFIINRANQK